MRIEQFRKIAQLEGLEFVHALLSLEERRFEEAQFLIGSTFEDINADFGIFPTAPAYPVYFAGDIREPSNKMIFMGINPGFNEDRHRQEYTYLKHRGLFEGYCRLYEEFRSQYENRLVGYYSNIAGFLRRYYDIQEKIDWNWFQTNFITLELIPYHSVNSNGLRINDIKKYRDVYFEIILKILRYLNPQKPIFINGFPTFRNLITVTKQKQRVLRPEFQDAIEYSTRGSVSTGKFNQEIDFIGIPFLNRPLGGIETVVTNVQRAVESKS